MRGDGSGRPALDQDPVDRIPRELFEEAGLTLGIIRVYAALRRRIGFEPAAKNYLECWPSLTTIGRDARVHRATAIEAIAWLTQRDYVLTVRNPRQSNTYVIVPWREQYRQIIAKCGRAEAIQWLMEQREQRAHASRRGQAAAADQRRGRELPPRWFQRSADPGSREMRKAHNNHRTTPVSAQKSPGDDLRSRRQTTPLVAGRRPRTVDQMNCVTENRGATGIALSPALQEKRQNTQSNVHGPVAALARAAKRMPAARPMTSQEHEARVRELRRMTAGWKQS